VPTEAGLSLFGVLKQADPALIDPGVTAQLECLLDDVVVGKQEMVGAIDAVCTVAERIIGKLKEGGAADGPPLLGAAVGNGRGTFPPTPAMKRFADSLARQKDIKPPPGYKTSISICRKFLSEHAPKKAEGEKLDSKPVSPAQMLYAKKIAQGKGVVIPEEAKANSAAMSAWMDSNRSAKRRRRGRKTAYKPAGSVAPQSTATTKRSRKRKPDASAAPLAPAQPNSVTGTPLRIPYGNKEVALKLGARYRSGGWYAPPGVDLSAFGERGWL
jgi:DNA topoisomerase III